jgi:hypothetical protein
VLADIDRVYGGPSDSRRKTRKLNPRGEEVDDAYDGADHESSNRGNNVRQSKSANATRSLTRKNQ